MATKFSGMAAYEAGLDLKPYDYEPHQLGDYDVDVGIKFCGICHSDIHAITGDWGKIPYPMIPGHEIVGNVIRVGPKVTKHKVGDAVGVGPEAFSCRNCRECSAEREQYCNEGVFLYGAKTIPGSTTTVHGGYANGIRVHEHFAIPLPSGFDMEKGAPLLCAGITVYKPLKDHNVGKGSKVGIIGLGGLGHLAVLLAAKMGADVYIFSRSHAKDPDAEKLGAKKIICESDEDFASHTQSFDFLLMTSSAELDYAKYIGLLKKRTGVFVFNGVAGEVKVAVGQLIFTQVNITGSLIGSPSETKDLLEFAAKNEVYPWTKTYSLSDADEAIKGTYNGKAHYRHVLKVENLLK